MGGRLRITSRSAARAVAAVAVAVCVLAACAHAGRATTGDATEQDFEHLWDYGNAALSEIRFRAELPRHPPGSEAHAQLLTQIARTHSLRRNFDQAHQLLDEVEASLAAATPKVRVRYDLERGRTFNSAGDPARASALFAAAWERAGAAGLDYYAIDAAHMLAIAAPPAGQHEWNLKALALTERTTDPRAKKWLVALYNNIGWTYHDQKDYPAALAMFEKALAAAEARGRPEAVRIARWTIARCLRSLGRVEEALRRQLALRDDAAGISANDGYVHEEIGENLLALGRAAEAVPSFARAHALLQGDGYLKANEPQRLARLRELGGAR